MRIRKHNLSINAYQLPCKFFSSRCAELKRGGRRSPASDTPLLPLKRRRRLTIMEIHLCSLSSGHNSSPGRGGGGRRGHNFATCRSTRRCCVSRDAVKQLLIKRQPPTPQVAPGAVASTLAQRGRYVHPKFFFSAFPPSRCFAEVGARRRSAET